MLNLHSRLSENIRMALRALTANKLRATLTMLGIIIGVAAVITLLSVGRGVERFIGDAFGALGTDLLFVLPGSPDQTSSGPPSQVLQGNVAIGPALTVKDVAALKDPLRVPDAAIIAPEVRTRGLGGGGRGCDPAVCQRRRIGLQRGAQLERRRGPLHRR